MIFKRRFLAQTPLIRFVVDLLYNKLYNKSTTNMPSTTNPQHLDMSSASGYNKSKCCTTNPQQME